MTQALERARIPLLVVAILVFFTGVVGAVTYDDDDAGVTETTADSTTTIVPSSIAGGAPPAQVSTTVADDPTAPTTTTADGDGGTPTTAGTAPTTTAGTVTSEPQVTSGPPPAATGDPGPSKIPAAGVYTYEIVADSGDGAETSSATTTVELLSGDRTNGRFKTTMERDGEGLISEATGSPDGFVVEKSIVKSAFGDSDECIWDPPFTILPRLAPGVTWSFASTCDTTISGANVTVSISGSGRVTGTEVIPVLGQQREVWVLETTTRTEADVQFGADTFEQDSEETATVRFDPSLGTDVSTKAVTVSSGQQSGTENSTSTLKSYKA